ncbi:MAG TPA: response regulator [Thermoplasmata archaeon]|nr:response regulator [Thermoplasmata archaeon]
MRLLVVDDDEVFRQALSEILTEDGHQVTTAPSVAKAIPELERNDFDVVLTDLKMPRESGMTLLRTVRERWPETLVAMVTGFASVDSAVEAMKLGAFDYLRKPFDVEQVRRLLAGAKEQIRWQGGPIGTTTPDILVRRWVDQGYDVLQVTARKVSPSPRVTVHVPDPSDLARTGDVVREFLAKHTKAGLILEGVDRFLAAHRRADVLNLVESFRREIEEKGPLVVAFGAGTLSEADARDLRSAVSAQATQGTLGTLASPIRRAVLLRLAKGSCSFSEAMRASGVDDSPKLSFHLRKLVEEGLVEHRDEEYRITGRGQEAVRLLDEMDSIGTRSIIGNALLPIPPGN